MAEILPFRALRFRSLEDPRALRRTAPSLEPLPRCHEGPGTPGPTVLDLESPERGGPLLEAMRAEDALVELPEPAVYVYRQDYLLANGLEKSRLCFLGLLDPWAGAESGVFPAADTDRGLVETCREGILRGGIQAGLVAVGYEDPAFEIEKLLERAIAGRTPARVAFPEETNHMWTVDGRGAIQAIARALQDQPLYLLDGIHRFRALRRLREEIAGERGARALPLCALYNLQDYAVSLGAYHALAALPSGFDVNRFVLALDPWFETTVYSFSGALDRVRALTDLREDLRIQGFAAPSIGAYIRGHAQFFLFQLRDGIDPEALFLPDVPPPLRSFDAMILRRFILPRGGVPPADLGLARETGAAIEAVDAGRFGAAFLLNPPNKGRLARAARAGLRLPVGSVRLDPAPRAGLVLHRVRQPLQVLSG